jgi:hypothetical protein
MPTLTCHHCLNNLTRPSIAPYVFRMLCATYWMKGSDGIAVKLLPCDHEVMGSSPENSLWWKCRERLCTTQSGRTLPDPTQEGATCTKLHFMCNVLNTMEEKGYSLVPQGNEGKTHGQTNHRKEWHIHQNLCVYAMIPVQIENIRNEIQKQNKKPTKLYIPMQFVRIFSGGEVCQELMHNYACSYCPTEHKICRQST